MTYSNQSDSREKTCFPVIACYCRSLDTPTDVGDSDQLCIIDSRTWEAGGNRLATGKLLQTPNKLVTANCVRSINPSPQTNPQTNLGI